MNQLGSHRRPELQEGIDQIEQTFGNAAGDMSSARHRNVVAYTSDLFSDKVLPGEVPAELAAYLDKVTLHAYKITDADVEALRTAGYSDDAIFELTVGGAFGAGLATWQSGMRAIESYFDSAEEGTSGAENKGQSHAA